VIAVRGLPTEAFSGKVELIASEVQTGPDGARYVRVLATVQNRDDRLRHGVEGSAQITTGRSTFAHIAARRIARWLRPSLFLALGR
jgi:hypothetical protein